MNDLTVKKALLVVSDTTAALSLSKSIADCGLKIMAVFEASELPATAFDLGPDVVILAVERGFEMNAYHIGHSAANRGIATLFVAHNSSTLALESLASAVPQSVVVDAHCTQDQLAAKIIEALKNGRNDPL